MGIPRFKSWVMGGNNTTITHDFSRGKKAI